MGKKRATSGIGERFDAVLMLTWSDWKNEPRSNRYHYATRFARQLPVLFFQHLYQKRDSVLLEESDVPNLDVITVNHGLRDVDVLEIRSLLAARGIKKPLLWIYDSINYQRLIEALPRGFRTYHATEDYLTQTSGWNQGMRRVAASVVQMLSQVDFVVACSEGVAKACVNLGRYEGPLTVVDNGCDAEFFLGRTGSGEVAEFTGAGRPVAIFQGGINQRLDYSLLIDVVGRMPDWDFHFCGHSADSKGWRRLLRQPNVRYFGTLQPEELVSRMSASTVGLIPYIQDEWIRNSFPLKAFEYVACGLPVVTVPITSLEREPRLMQVASTPAEFETAIRSAAPSRYDACAVQERRKAALKNSYETRFSSMASALLQASQATRNRPRKLRVAVLYDCMISLHVNTLREHLEAFEKYSRHTIEYIPATSTFWAQPPEDVIGQLDLSIFDVAVVHYSIRLSVPNHLDEGVARALEHFHGLKVLFIQDEYEGTETARAWMERLSFDIVYTCVPEDGLSSVYPPYRFPATEFLPTLTGYVPEDAGLETFAKPLEDRKNLLAYRGRRLPAVYGELGYEKYRIGAEMRSIALERGLRVDIEVEDNKRIYGTSWYAFLGSARATLGTESGANVFDFDGFLRKRIEKLKRANPGISFEEIASRFLSTHEGQVRMNQISPKVFEAIRLRTALVLFEGDYSGVIIPEEHFIPLKKDFSNIDEVLKKLQDDAYIANITERAYRDIVASGKYSYRQFIESLDADFERRLLQTKRAKLLQSLVYVSPDGSLKQALPLLPSEIAVGAHPLGRPMSLMQAMASTGKEATRVLWLRQRVRHWTWNRLPLRARRAVIRSARFIVLRARDAGEHNVYLRRLLWASWRMLPLFARSRVERLLKRH